MAERPRRGSRACVEAAVLGDVAERDRGQELFRPRMSESRLPRGFPLERLASRGAHEKRSGAGDRKWWCAAAYATTSGPRMHFG